MESDSSKLMFLKDVLTQKKDDDEILTALEDLEPYQMTVDILQNTGIGKIVNQYKKRGGRIGLLSKTLVNKWKQDVAKHMKESSERETGDSDGLKRSGSPEITKNQKRRRCDPDLNVSKPSLDEVPDGEGTHNFAHERQSKNSHKKSRSRGDSRFHSSDEKLKHDNNRKKVEHSGASRSRCKKTHADHDDDGSYSEYSDREIPRKKPDHTESDGTCSNSKNKSQSCEISTEILKRKKSKASRSQSPVQSQELSRHKRISSKSNERQTARKSTLPQFQIPTPLSVAINSDDILASLPQTITNYKPLPHLTKGVGVTADEEIGRKKYSRSVVYSGRRTRTLTQVPSLFNACMEVLIAHIDNIDYVGGAPFFVLKPLLAKCTPEQLYRLEEYNPHLLEDSAELWAEHCQRDFRGKQSQREEMESWRELYLRLHDERERKFKKLATSISAQHSALKDAGRKTKIAFAETMAKPPRDVIRKQKLHGTGGAVRPKDINSSAGSSSEAWRRSRTPLVKDQSMSKIVPPFDVPKNNRKSGTAPMMANAMRMMKKIRR